METQQGKGRPEDGGPEHLLPRKLLDKKEVMRIGDPIGERPVTQNVQLFKPEYQYKEEGPK